MEPLAWSKAVWIVQYDGASPIRQDRSGVGGRGGDKSWIGGPEVRKGQGVIAIEPKMERMGSAG